jgi:hypothetical protein
MNKGERISYPFALIQLIGCEVLKSKPRLYSTCLINDAKRKMVNK